MILLYTASLVYESSTLEAWIKLFWEDLDMCLKAFGSERICMLGDMNRSVKNENWKCYGVLKEVMRCLCWEEAVYSKHLLLAQTDSQAHMEEGQ